MTRRELNGTKEIHWYWGGVVMRWCEGQRGSDYARHKNFFHKQKNVKSKEIFHEHGAGCFSKTFRK
jgi:hypothetical protein